ncbi:RNA-directed DNA polymerase, eukaryota, reverse transcriptase zinc-binding domain protein [Tanacetum coccineum]
MLMWLSFITLVRRFVKGGNGLQMGISVLKVLGSSLDGMMNAVGLLSIIYVDNYYISRRALWHNLVGHASLMCDPWVLLGDFNATRNLEDHSCGEFKECVQRMQVMDVNATGRHFTWNKKPKGSNCILKKIDRIMCNYHFLVDFPGSFAIVQPYRISDHSPCVIRIPKGLKTPLRKLLHDQENLHDRVNRLCVELDEAQKAIDRNPSCSLLRDEHAHYLLAFKEASLDEERIVKSKCARNRIDMVRDSSNVLHEGNAVPGAFFSHYEQFLGLEGASTPLDDQGLFTRVLANHKRSLLSLFTIDFKKMSTGSRLMLDQWKIPSSCFDHDKSSRLSWIVFTSIVLLLVCGMLAGFHVLILVHV